jgi:hypothetical protein
LVEPEKFYEVAKEEASRMAAQDVPREVKEYLLALERAEEALLHEGRVESPPEAPDEMF